MRLAPRSTDRSALKRVLVDLGWPAKVIRAQGFQCWLVSSATGPPSRSFVLDDAQVVATPETIKPNPVVGGDRELVSKPFHCEDGFLILRYTCGIKKL